MPLLNSSPGHSGFPDKHPRISSLRSFILIMMYPSECFIKHTTIWCECTLHYTSLQRSTESPKSKLSHRFYRHRSKQKQPPAVPQTTEAFIHRPTPVTQSATTIYIHTSRNNFHLNSMSHGLTTWQEVLQGCTPVHTSTECLESTVCP